MSRWNRRRAGMDALAFWIGRCAFFTINPFAVGYFLCAYGQELSAPLMAIFLSLGIASVMDAISGIKYALIFVTIAVVEAIMKKTGRAISSHIRALSGAVITTSLAMTKAFFSPHLYEQAALAALEGLVVYLSYYFFKRGTGFLLYHKKREAMSNEELVSVAILMGMVIYSVPRVVIYSISLPQLLSYLLVLSIGYKYGSGSGAVAGAVIGVVLSYQNVPVTYIGIFCILGICSGLFQEIGKLGAGIAFVTTGASLGYLYEHSLLKMPGIFSLLAALPFFFLFPAKWVEPVCPEKKDANDYVKQCLQLMTKNKFRSFSESLQKLSQSFVSYSENRSLLGCDDVNSIFEEVSGKFCKECTECRHCWQENYDQTYLYAQDIFDTAKKKGTLTVQDVPKDFLAQCIYADAFVTETNKSLEMAMLNLKWYNRLMESRQAVSGQLEEMAQIVKDFASDISEMKQVKQSMEEQIMNKLRIHHVLAKNLILMEDKNGHLEVHMQARVKKGRCVTTKEVAAYLSEVVQKKVRPLEQTKTMVPQAVETLLFGEDTTLKVLTGVARVKKEGEEVSGDNFSFLELDSGELIMILCDGMGAGEQASRESEAVIDLIEDFMEAGFHEAAAIHLINSFYVLHVDGQSFSTIDMGIINRYDGSCNFVKMGAAATFLKHKNCVDTILSSSLPAGMLEETQLAENKRQVQDGDFIVMVTDGIIDCFPGNNKERHVAHIVENLTSQNPKEIANEILNQSLFASGGRALDDMTVIVAGIWEKS
ncbi:MAG: stage sporulation protein [Clostridiales bacterium]|nr:stage sporulation protein [Clostridiales bacterium]